MINRAAAISQRARAPRVLATMGPTPESYTNCLGVGSHTPRRINVGPGIGCSHSSGRTGQTWRFLSRLEERLGESREEVRREIEELWMDAKPATGQLLRPASGSALTDFPGGLLLAGLHLRHCHQPLFKSTSRPIASRSACVIANEGLSGPPLRLPRGLPSVSRVASARTGNNILASLLPLANIAVTF